MQKKYFIRLNFFLFIVLLMLVCVFKFIQQELDKKSIIFEEMSVDNIKKIEWSRANGLDKYEFNTVSSIQEIIHIFQKQKLLKIKRRTKDGECYGINFYWKDGKNTNVTIIENEILIGEKYYCMAQKLDLVFCNLNTEERINKKNTIFDKISSNDVIKIKIAGTGKDSMTLKSKQSINYILEIFQNENILGSKDREIYYGGMPVYLYLKNGTSMGINIFSDKIEVGNKRYNTESDLCEKLRDFSPLLNI